MRSGRDLRDVARSHLVALAEQAGETITLSAPAEHGAVTIDFVPSGSFVRSVAALGRESVGHATATGKVAVAFGKARLPEGPLDALTPRTITDPSAMASEIEAVRRRGWAQVNGEREPELNAIAAPIVAHAGELAAIIGVQGPAFRFDEPAMRAALSILLGVAGEISGTLGPS